MMTVKKGVNLLACAAISVESKFNLSTCLRCWPEVINQFLSALTDESCQEVRPTQEDEDLMTKVLQGMCLTQAGMQQDQQEWSTNLVIMS